MSDAGAPLLPAVHSAVEELRRARLRFEVFARAGESAQLRRHADGSWERRRSREVGVACRVAGDGRASFAACSGSSARAGREAARAALGTMLPGADPLPPRAALGCLAVPPRPRPTSRDELEALAHAFADALAAGQPRLAVLDLRLVEGAADSLLTTGEGFSCRAEAGGCVVEALLAAGGGPLRHLHWAARTARELRPELLVPPAVAAVLASARGGRARRGLADVVLAPAAAARLVTALAVAAGSGRLVAVAERGGGVRPAGTPWHIVDDRVGAAALLPLPCDGEGLAIERVELVAGGRAAGRWSSWAAAARSGARAGGTVRASYQDEPRPAPANLVVLAAERQPRVRLLAQLRHGFLLDLPDGEVRVAGDTFAMRAAALAVAGGRLGAAHPVVELRGSFRRLLRALAAVGDDDQAFARECAVVTPSLLLRGLEIA